MKRIAVYGMAAVLAVVFSSLAFASDKVSGQIVVKNDWHKPLDGQRGFYTHGVDVYASYKWLGIGVDQWGGEQCNYWEARPYVTLNKGPFYAVAGYAANTLGTGHIQVGSWYVKKFGKLDVFLDLRYYFGVKGKANDFLDFFASAKHPVGEKFFVGIEGEFIKWWGKEKDHNWSFVGPIGGYKITENVSFFVRPTVSWDNSKKGCSQSFGLRTGIKFNF